MWMRGLIVAIAVLLGWVATVCFHEFGHAIVAYYGGDTTVKEKGYLTLNPLKYTDIGYSLVLPVIFLIMGGIALPGAAVYINTKLLRNRAWQSAVSAAGPLATGLVAIALAIPFQLGWATPDFWGWNALALIATFQVAGFFFNLLPIPSFDGFGILEPWLPQTVQQTTQRWGRYGYLVLLGLFWTVPAFSQGFWGLVSHVSEGLGISQAMMSVAYREFAESGKLLFVALLIGAVLYRRLAQKPQGKADQDSLFPSSEPQEQEATLARYDLLIAAQQFTPDLWFQRGQILSSMGKFEAAIASYDKALESYDPLIRHSQNPNSQNSNLQNPHSQNPNFEAEVWYGRAIAQHQLERYPEALADYSQTLSLMPNHSYAWVHKAKLLEQQQNHKAAINAYDQSLKVHPANALGWQGRGKILRQLGQHEEALHSFNQALKYERSRADLWIDQAEMLEIMGQPQRAIFSYRNASRLDPENIAVWRSQGNLLLQVGRTKDAVRSYDAALRQNPQDSATLLLRGLTRFILNRKPLALQDFATLQSLLREDLTQPPQQSETLRNLLPLKPIIVQKFMPMLEESSASVEMAIAQGLLLSILQRPKDALRIYRQAAVQTPLPELNYLETWALSQINKSQS